MDIVSTIDVLDILSSTVYGQTLKPPYLGPITLFAGFEHTTVRVLTIRRFLANVERLTRYGSKVIAFSMKNHPWRNFLSNTVVHQNRLNKAL